MMDPKIEFFRGSLNLTQIKADLAGQDFGYRCCHGVAIRNLFVTDDKTVFLNTACDTCRADYNAWWNATYPDDQKTVADLPTEDITS